MGQRKGSLEEGLGGKPLCGLVVNSLPDGFQGLVQFDQTFSAVRLHEFQLAFQGQRAIFEIARSSEHN